MAISTVDGLLAGFTGKRQKLPIAKGGLSTMVTGGNGSYWRSTGAPGQGAIPAAPATCNAATLGGVPYTLPTGGDSTYLARLMLGSTVAQTTEVHDRLAHMGGLNGTLTTAQTVGLDLNALAGTDNIGQRKGRSDWGTVQWWLEGYTQLGTAGATATVNYTNQLGVAQVTTVSIPANFRVSALLPITPLPGDNIRSVDSITLSVTTGAAGNFGVTATIQRSEISCFTANIGTLYDWTQLGLPPIYDNSCLFFVSNNSTTSAGTLNGAITLIQG